MNKIKIMEDNYMLWKLRFTSRSIVVCRVDDVLYWPCGSGRWWGCSGNCWALNCWWCREGAWSPLRVCRRGSSLERPPPPPDVPVTRPPTTLPKTPIPPLRRPLGRSFEPPSPSALPNPPTIIKDSNIRGIFLWTIKMVNWNR